MCFSTALSSCPNLPTLSFFYGQRFSTAAAQQRDSYVCSIFVAFPLLSLPFASAVCISLSEKTEKDMRHRFLTNNLTAFENFSKGLPRTVLPSRVQLADVPIILDKIASKRCVCTSLLVPYTHADTINLSPSRSLARKPLHLETGNESKSSTTRGGGRGQQTAGVGACIEATRTGPDKTSSPSRRLTPQQKHKRAKGI